MLWTLVNIPDLRHYLFRRYRHCDWAKHASLRIEHDSDTKPQLIGQLIQHILGYDLYNLSNPFCITESGTLPRTISASSLWLR